jgi:hypothetical protein
MTQLIVAAAVAAVIIVGVCLVLVSRSRRDDEGERFRRVADLTSRWSRQVQQVDRPAVPAMPAEQPVVTRATESADPT